MYAGDSLRGCASPGGCLAGARRALGTADTATAQQRMYDALSARGSRQTSTLFWTALGVVVAAGGVWVLNTHARARLPPVAMPLAAGAAAVLIAAITGWSYDSEMIARLRQELIDQGVPATGLPS